MPNLLSPSEVARNLEQLLQQKCGDRVWSFDFSHPMLRIFSVPIVDPPGVRLPNGQIIRFGKVGKDYVSGECFHLSYEKALDCAIQSLMVLIGKLRMKEITEKKNYTWGDERRRRHYIALFNEGLDMRKELKK